MDRDRSFGRLLARLRKASDLTQEGLAQHAFCAIDTIKKIESGVRRPSRQLAETFADCLALVGDERAAFLTAARSIAVDEPGTTGVASTRKQLSTLPQPPTPFVGRTAELSALSALFADPTTRLVTLVGPGGIGKTRLAVVVAEQLLHTERFAQGVYFVPLAALDSAAEILSTLAEVLEFPFDAGNSPARTPRQQLFDYLHAKRLVLVFDNIEHLLDDPRMTAGGKSEDAADLVAALLEYAPEVVIIVTSRERMRLRQEILFMLTGLDLPGNKALSRYSAIDLFVQSARRLRPDFNPAPEQFEAIARICRMVEGMPLAIELAAGWIDTLAIMQIEAELEQGLDLLATELRDVPARHQSMRAIFAASYQRLGAAEQAVFIRLAILRGGGTFPALQAIVQATLPQLQRLIGASLLTHDEGRGRYTMHELLRQFGQEKLVAKPEVEARTRDQHAAYYCEFVGVQGRALSGPEQQAGLALLDGERENIRAAWGWAAKRARIDLLVQAVDGLGYFYEWRAYLDDGDRAFQSAAVEVEAQASDDRSRCLLSKVSAWQSSFKRLQGDVVGAEQLLRQSLVLLAPLPNTPEMLEARAFALLQLSLVASEGLLDDSHQYLEESLALYQALDRRWEASHVLLWLGDHARYLGEFEKARAYFQASLLIRTDVGDRRGIAEVQIWDAHVASEIGEVVEAEKLARQSYDFYEHFGDPANRAFGLGELGIMLMTAGKYAEACDGLQKSLDLYQDLGNRTMKVYVLGWLAVAFLATGQYDAAKELSELIKAQIDELHGARSGIAFMRHYSGWVALTLEEYDEAKILLEESVSLHREVGNTGRVGWSLAHLGYVHWLLGDSLRGQAELLEVIQVSARQQAYVPLLLALPAVALILAEQGHATRAIELYALAWQHPLIANAQFSIDIFGRRLDTVVAAQSPQSAAAAKARGSALDLWVTAALLENELRTLGWGQDGLVQSATDESAQSLG